MSVMPPAGWYPDDQGETRWWDGANWGELAPWVAPSVPVGPPAPPKRTRRAWPWVTLGVVGVAMIAAALAGPAAKTKNTSASGSTSGVTAAAVSPVVPSSATSTTPIDSQAAPTSSSHLVKPPAVRSTVPKAKVFSTTHVVRPTTDTAPRPPAAFNYCGAPANPWHYNFCGGSLITSPAADVCNYFNCIANFGNGVGYMVQCNDGTYSMSGGRRGACSSHGGEGRPVYRP